MFETPVFEVRRVSTINVDKHPQYPDAKSTLPVAQQLLEGRAAEALLVMYFTHEGRLIGSEIAGLGSDDHVEINLSNMFRGAILSGASMLVVAHNHPGSAVAQPSLGDKRAFETYKKAGKLFKIDVMDFFVITDDPKQYYIHSEHPEHQQLPYYASLLPPTDPLDAVLKGLKKHEPLY